MGQLKIFENEEFGQVRTVMRAGCVSRSRARTTRMM